MTQSSVLSPQSADGWRRNLYVIWLATFASLVGGQLAMPFLPLFIQRDLGVSDPGEAAIWTGIAATGTGLVMAIMSPIWGILADRHGRKAMLVRAQLAIGISNAASGLVGAPWQLVAIRAVQGGFSGIVGAARALVAGSVPRERLPWAMGLIQSAVYLGSTLGPAIGGAIGSALGFRAAFLATGCINVAAGLAAALYIREHQSVPGRSRQPAGRDSLTKLLRSKALATLIAMLFLSSAAITCLRPVLPLLLAEVDPGDVALTSGLAFALLGMSGAVASLMSSRAGGAVGLRLLLVLAAVGGGATNVAVAAAGTTLMMLILQFGAGLCQGTFASCAAALVSLHAPASRQGTAFGVITSAQALAMGSGPLLGGLIASAISLRAAFVAAGVMLLLAAALGLTLPPPPQASERQQL